MSTIVPRRNVPATRPQKVGKMTTDSTFAVFEDFNEPRDDA